MSESIEHVQKLRKLEMAFFDFVILSFGSDTPPLAALLGY